MKAVAQRPDESVDFPLDDSHDAVVEAGFLDGGRHPVLQLHALGDSLVKQIANDLTNEPGVHACGAFPSLSPSLFSSR